MITIDSICGLTISHVMSLNHQLLVSHLLSLFEELRFHLLHQSNFIFLHLGNIFNHNVGRYYEALLSVIPLFVSLFFSFAVQLLTSYTYEKHSHVLSF